MKNKVFELIKLHTSNLQRNKQTDLSLENEQLKLAQEIVKLFAIPHVSGSFPSDSEIETAALTYRDKSDNENTNEDTMMIDVHWYDKQEAFTAGVKWFLENYR